MSEGIGIIRQKRGPIYVEWNIKDYFSCTAEKECLESPDFFVCDETWWWLQLYPNGEIENSGYVSFYLVKGKSNVKYDIAFKLGMMKPNGKVFHAVDCNHNFEKTVRHGCRSFLLRSDLLKSKDVISSDGVLRAFCIIRFVDNPVMHTACGTYFPRSIETLTQNLKDLYLDGRLCDVTVAVKDAVFQAHKCILAARSPVFAAMFEHDMVEKRTNSFSITDCDPHSFKEFLLFLYTGKLENVSPSDVFGLYAAADKYDVKELKEECLQLMEHNLSADTFSDTVLIAMNYKESELVMTVTKFFIQNAERILRTTKWQLFKAENSTMANKLLKLVEIIPVTDKTFLNTREFS